MILVIDVIMSLLVEGEVVSVVVETTSLVGLKFERLLCLRI